MLADCFVEALNVDDAHHCGVVAAREAARLARGADAGIERRAGAWRQLAPRQLIHDGVVVVESVACLALRLRVLAHWQLRGQLWRGQRAVGGQQRR